MVTFADLKRNSQAELDRIAKDAERLGGGGGFKRDERYWKPVVDSAGNGSAVIRYLPQPGEELLPIVKKFSYGFMWPQTKKWYIENSPATIGEPDPVAELNSADWDSGTEEGKNLAKIRRRRLSFVSNILVIKHAARPADEGNVYLYEYGKKLYEKINEKMNPPFADIERMNPFHPDLGANFHLRVMKVNGFPNYDKSDFAAPGPYAPNDEIAAAIWKRCYSLEAEIAPDKFKPYADLKRKLDQVMGIGSGPTTADYRAGTAQVSPVAPPTAEQQVTPPWADSTDDSGISWFEKLAANQKK